MKTYLCEECGGREISFHIWFHPNRVGDARIGQIEDEGEGWCSDCDAEVGVLRKFSDDEEGIGPGGDDE
jgi:hypothetical protein